MALFTPPPPASFDADLQYESTAKEAAKRAGSAVVSRFRSLLPSSEDNVYFACEVAYDPAAAALEMTKIRRPDLVVIGSRCHSLLGRAFLGSFTNYLVNHCDCDVHIVRPRPAGRSSAATSAAASTDRVVHKAISTAPAAAGAYTRAGRERQMTPGPLLVA